MALHRYVLVSFLAGVALHSAWPLGKIPAAFWVFCFVGLGVVLWGLRESPKIRVVGVCLLLFFLGLWRFDVSLPSPIDGMKPWVGSETTMVGVVTAVAPAQTGSTMTLRVQRVEKKTVEGPGDRVFVRVYGRSVPAIGSTIAVTCMLRDLRIDPEKPAYYWYGRAKRGIWTECSGATQISQLAKPQPYDLLGQLDAWRRWLTARIGTLYPRDDATLLSGILYGDQDLSDAQGELMRRAGLMHLVAVSGSNVTIVVSVLSSAVLALGFPRRRAFWILTGGICAFLGFVGFSASVVRAGIMGWLVLLARHSGRAPSASRLLLVTAVALALINPWLLAFDGGFALSFLATWGLLAWTPIIADACSWMPERFGLREAFATTAGATLMTAPYLAWSFGRMSLAGLFTNMIALPLVPWLMLWGAIAAAWGTLPGFQIVSLPAYGMLHVLDWIAHLSDLTPWLDLQIQSFGLHLLIGLYLLLWKIWRECRKRSEGHP